MSGRKRIRLSSPLDSSEEDDDQRTNPTVARGRSTRRHRPLLPLRTPSRTVADSEELLSASGGSNSTRRKSRRGLPTSKSDSVNDGPRAREDHSGTPVAGPSSRGPQLASSNTSTMQSTRLESKLDTTVFGLRFPPAMTYEAIIPIGGVPTAVDHEDQKLYVLTYHDDDNGTEPGTVIHCLNLKTKTWDGFLHKIKSAHSFDNSPGHYLPPCVFTSLTFIQHRNGKKYLFIVGGYFGDPEDHLSKSRNLHLNDDDMRILVIDIAQKSWDVLHVLGRVPRSYGHAVVSIGDTVYVFGGRKNLPENIHANDWNPSCHPDELFESYSILTFDGAFGQWIWSTRNKPFPKPRVKTMGYTNRATLVERGHQVRILLRPGVTGREGIEGPGFNIVPDNLTLYNPDNDSFMSWEEDSSSAPGIVGFNTLRTYPSPKHNKGISDAVVFAIHDDDCTEVKLYYYKPAENEGFRFFGTIKNTITRRRLVDEAQKSGASREFIGFETVGSDMYILATNYQDSLDTVVQVKFLGIDDS
ncbi:hypothetical protein K435DRAFT_846337 [Dendrothele bispora CBS 962.96]|uniref:Galactose oxidase n=1 Tax=Dendrothele bispora (strain CBS 962.96) TaxID=1314807 RepID=A0A4S8KNA0_DENBC|nr:hypothetical protein K435DRAFT_846337 [Dendrothele bispora CBS 962.96]